MPKYIVKVSRYRKQHRITLPTSLVSSAGLGGEKVLVLDVHRNGKIQLRKLAYLDTVEVEQGDREVS